MKIFFTPLNPDNIFENKCDDIQVPINSLGLTTEMIYIIKECMTKKNIYIMRIYNINDMDGLIFADENEPMPNPLESDYIELAFKEDFGNMIEKCFFIRHPINFDFKGHWREIDDKWDAYIHRKIEKLSVE